MKAWRRRMLSGGRRHRLLPRDVSFEEPVGGAAAITIDVLKSRRIINPDEGVALGFRAAIAGDRCVCLPATVEVKAQLVSRQGDVRSVAPYENRAEDLFPGRHGFAVQSKRAEVYRYELTRRARECVDALQPTYDFSRYQRVEIVIRVRARDGTEATETVVLPLGCLPAKVDVA